MDDIKTAIAAADIAVKEGRKPSTESLVELFRALRKSKIQRPDILTKYGRQLIQSGAVGGIEVWSLYEQIYIGALECGDISLVDECSKRLNKKFPDSVRVKRLLGMQYEYNKEHKKAQELYDSLLASNPSNLLILKRKVCVYKAQGDMRAAALEIQKILKLMYGDASLWLELADIHMNLGDYQAAAFCLEELVLLDPHNAIHNAHLGDVYYTLGEFGNLLKARKQYTLSLNLQCGRLNVRALYGLIASAKALDGLNETGTAKCFDARESAINKELLSWGRDELSDITSGSTEAQKGDTNILTYSCRVL